MNRIWALLLPLVLVLSACAGSDSSVTPDTPNFTFSTDITSAETNLKTMNGGSVVVGWNRLVGTTTINGANAQVEMLASVDYVNGSGDFFGFMTITTADNSMLTMRMHGDAVRNATTGDTAFTSELKVVGGNGVYNNATGTGSFTGFRDGDLGGLVHIDVTATVR